MPECLFARAVRAALALRALGNDFIYKKSQQKKKKTQVKFLDEKIKILHLFLKENLLKQSKLFCEDFAFREGVRSEVYLEGAATQRLCPGPEHISDEQRTINAKADAKKLGLWTYLKLGPLSLVKKK